MFRTFSCILATTLIASPALAQGQDVSLVGSVKLVKTIADKGTTKVTLEEPKIVVPGDRLLFSTSYANKSAQKVENFIVTNPVPAAVRVADESAGTLLVSVDGGKSYDALATLTVKGADGVMRPAAAQDITHIRWTVPSIAPSASGKVEYYAIVR